MVCRLFYGLLQKTNAAIYNVKKSEIIVLVFHEICSEEDTEDKCHFTTIESFEQFVKTYKNNIFSINEDFCKFKSISNSTKLILTFDDIYESAYLNGISILKKNNIPFTIFVCPDLIGKPGYINKNQLKELCLMENCEIAFHLNHHFFTRKMKKDIFLNEINCSNFENEYGIKCSYFAFPYGSMFASKRFGSKKFLLARYMKTFSTTFAHMSLSTYMKKRHFLPRMTYSEKTKHLIKIKL